MIDEASALQAVLDESEVLPGRAAIAAAVSDHARDLVEREWPLLRRSAATTDRTPQIARLREVARSAGESVHQAVSSAPRGRALALTLVTLAISFCFLVLVVNARPFVGDYAIKPEGLLQVIENARR